MGGQSAAVSGRGHLLAHLPVVHAPDPGRVSQHGLELVMAVCSHFEVHREPVGKRVMAAVMPADDALRDTAGRPG